MLARIFGISPREVANQSLVDLDAMWWLVRQMNGGK